MKKLGWLLLVLLAGAGYIGYDYVMKQKKLFKKVCFDFKDFKANLFNIIYNQVKTLSGTLNLITVNKDKLDVIIRKIYFDVFIEGVKIGRIENKEALVIKANTTTKTLFTFNIPIENLSGLISVVQPKLLNINNIAIRYKGKAVVKAGVLGYITLPVDIDTTIGEMAKPNPNC